MTPNILFLYYPNAERLTQFTNLRRTWIPLAFTQRPRYYKQVAWDQIRNSYIPITCHAPYALAPHPAPPTPCLMLPPPCPIHCPPRCPNLALSTLPVSCRIFIKSLIGKAVRNRLFQQVAGAGWTPPGPPERHQIINKPGATNFRIINKRFWIINQTIRKHAGFLRLSVGHIIPVQKTLVFIVVFVY